MTILFFTIFGLAGLLGATAYLVTTRRALARGIRSEGTVVARPWVQVGDGNSTRETIVEFQTAEGSTQRFKGKFSSFIGGPAIGERVPVVYDRAKPDDALIDTWTQTWIPALIGFVFAGIGATGVIVAAVMQ